MKKSCLLFALCFLFILPSPSLSQIDPLLSHVLLEIKPSDLLDVTVTDGSRYLGRFGGIQEGQLLLQQPEVESPRLVTRNIDLVDIVRIRRQGSGAGQGFSTGFTTGAVIGGSLSLLWGIALDSIDGDGGNIGAIAGLTMLGTTAGGVGLGAIGAGLGALAEVWTVIYEAPLAPPAPQAHIPGNSRVCVGFGLATGHEKSEDFQESGLFGMAGLQKQLGSRLEFGPELAYYDLDGTIREDGYMYTSVRTTSPIITIGLAATLQSYKSGWSPYLVAGTGYYIGGGEYLGASFGGGIRYRTEKLQDMKLEIRDHVNVYDNDRNFHLDYFITVGANFSFAL